MTRLATLIQEYKGTEPMTVPRLARESGIQERTAYRHVRGDTTPNIAQAAAYAKVLGRPIEDLVDSPVRPVK